MFPIESLKRITESQMVMTATITRRGEFVDEGGGSGHYLPGASLEVPCRVAPLGNSPQERLIADQLSDTSLEVLVVPLGADLQTDDEYVVVSNGKKYTVLGKVPTPTFAMHDRFVVKSVG